MFRILVLSGLITMAVSTANASALDDAKAETQRVVSKTADGEEFCFPEMSGKVGAHVLFGYGGGTPVDPTLSLHKGNIHHSVSDHLPTRPLRWA